MCIYVCVKHLGMANIKKKVVCFLLGNSPASEFYMPTFRNTLFDLHRQVDMENDWG